MPPIRDIDGKKEKQLTNGEDDSWAWSSPDGQWVVYHRGALGKRTLRRVSIVGGNSEQLTDYPSVCPVVSPDGRWISCYYRMETKAPWKLAIIPLMEDLPFRLLVSHKTSSFSHWCGGHPIVLLLLTHE